MSSLTHKQPERVQGLLISQNMPWLVSHTCRDLKIPHFTSSQLENFVMFLREALAAIFKTMIRRQRSSILDLLLLYKQMTRQPQCGVISFILTQKCGGLRRLLREDREVCHQAKKPPSALKLAY